MKWKLSLTAFTIVLATLSAGCAPGAHSPGTKDGSSASPLALVGEDTGIKIDFASHPAPGSARALGGNELCFITAGPVVIVCIPQGSYMLLGPDDAIELVAGNPLWHLKPVEGNSSDAALLRGFGTIFLIAGSVDRLPAALSAYLGEPGSNRTQAVILARKLLAERGAELSGVARGGTFKVSVRLTSSGRKKLLDALQTHEEDGGVQMVRADRP
ncbi:MAG: hypothetical protein JWO87_1430 [Phycisphaerales bacterium]|nr:hypothetical protein [Phycisphaerales bacterium]